MDVRHPAPAGLTAHTVISFCKWETQGLQWFHMVHFTIQEYVVGNITFSDLIHVFRPWCLASFFDLPFPSPPASPDFQQENRQEENNCFLNLEVLWLKHGLRLGLLEAPSQAWCLGWIPQNWEGREVLTLPLNHWCQTAAALVHS